MPLLRFFIAACLLILATRAEEPFHTSELIFAPEHWHVHGSCVVEAANGDLLACWFQGSGERTADDVKIEGARLKKGAREWSGRFVMADTPNYPDTNCAMFVDPQGRLWLIWPAILANTWESALLKVRISSDWSGEAAPKWEKDDVIHITPDARFLPQLNAWMAELEKSPLMDQEVERMRGQQWLAYMRSYSTNKLNQRLGWMTRAHPFVLDGKRLILPLYSDGFSFSLMAITDDWGKTWRTSNPVLGLGNIQPSIVQRADGSLYTLMRDNGPPPKRLLQSESRDRGETWTIATDSEHPNSGTGAEIIKLKNGHWALINNDLERGRHRLTVSISTDEGKTWPFKRALEDSDREENRFHYPSIMQARDGSLHATYSHHVGNPQQKSIKHAHFNEAWVTNAPAKPRAAFPLQADDVVAFLGGSDVSAAQFTGHLETLLALRQPRAKFRTFAWEGDTVFDQPREINFPKLTELLQRAGANVLICQFGRMESMLGATNATAFEAAYAKFLDQLNGTIALVIPPRFEPPENPLLPDLTKHNASLAEHAAAIRRLAAKRNLQLIDLSTTAGRLTSGGLQITPAGHAALARAFAETSDASVDEQGRFNNPVLEKIREAVIAKNRCWFDYYRPQNWAFLGGDRTEQPSSRDHRDRNLRWFPEEMKQFTTLIARAEAQVQATIAEANR